MKKSLLLFSAVLIAGFTNAQEAVRSVVLTPLTNQSSALELSGHTFTAPSSLNTFHSGSKTTLVTAGRWYDYVDSVFPNNISTFTPFQNLEFTDLDIWQDTTALFGYSTPSYDPSDFTSIGLSFDPMAPNWNNTSYFPAGEIAIESSNAYTIDSIMVSGFYGRNPSKNAVVDTLVVTFVYGAGAATDNLALGLSYGGSLATTYGVTGVDFLTMYSDSLHNRAGGSGGSITLPIPTPTVLTTGVYKFPLTTLDSITSGSFGPGGTLNKVYPRPGRSDGAMAFAVPAGNYASVSVSFISGDHTYPTTHLPSGYNDTVRYASGAQKYGSFSPGIGFNSTATSGGTPQYPPYIGSTGTGATDWTSGYFKEYGAHDVNSVNAYTAQWGWQTASGTAASSLQYPYIWFHALCTGCATLGNPALGVKNVLNLNEVTVTPNPANDNLNISFSNGQNATVTVSLTNMLGQVVATQKTTTGTSVFNTSALSGGVYIYTLEANGERSTGRVVVAH